MSVLGRRVSRGLLIGGAVVALGGGIAMATTTRGVKVMTKSGEPTAYVHEMADPTDGDRYVGRFELAVQGPGARLSEGPENLSLTDAVELAKSKARVVLVAMGGEVRYWAGAQPVPGLPRLPSDTLVVKPRPRGTPLDGSIQVRDWDWALYMSDTTPSLAKRVLQTVARHQAVRNVRQMKKDPEGMLTIRFQVRANDGNTAARIVDALYGALLELPGAADAKIRAEEKMSDSG